tara:strand:+ start:546 stop:731 length:186 start_codon:yes stop_codon:yes gene_type:complete
MSDLINAICDILLAIGLIINLYRASQTDRELDKIDEKLNKLLKEQASQISKELDRFKEQCD